MECRSARSRVIRADHKVRVIDAVFTVRFPFLLTQFGL